MSNSRFLILCIETFSNLSSPTTSKSLPWNFRSSWVLSPFMRVSELRLDTQFDNVGVNFSKELNLTTCLDLQIKGEVSMPQT